MLVLSWSERKWCFLTINFYRSPLAVNPGVIQWGRGLALGPICLMLFMFWWLSLSCWAVSAEILSCLMCGSMSSLSPVQEICQTVLEAWESCLWFIMYCTCSQDYISITAMQGRAVMAQIIHLQKTILGWAHSCLIHDNEAAVNDELSTGREGSIEAFSIKWLKWLWDKQTNTNSHLSNNIQSVFEWY